MLLNQTYCQFVILSISWDHTFQTAVKHPSLWCGNTAGFLSSATQLQELYEADQEQCEPPVCYPFHENKLKKYIYLQP